MNSTPLVSVLVRTCDRPVLLLEAVNSIALQSYRPLEVVVVNDGGSNSAAALQQLCADKNLTLRWLQCDGHGRSAAANTALAAASGEYCLFLDDDDWIDPAHISGLLAALQQQPAMLVAYSDVRTVHEDGNVNETAFNFPYDALRLRIENYIPIHAALFSRSVLSKGCRFNTALDRFEDWDFWLQVSQYTDFQHVPVCTANYRIASASGFGTKTAEELGQLRVAFYRLWLPRFSDEQLQAVLDRSRQFPRIASLESEVLTLQNFVQHLQNYEQQLNQSIGELHERHHSETTRLNQHIAELNDANKAEISRLNQHIVDVQNTHKAALAKLNQHIAELQSSYHQLMALLQQRNAELEQRHLEVVAIQQQLNELNEKYLRLQHDYTAEQGLIAALRRDLDLIYNSRSWKLTRPLRFVSKIRYFLRVEGFWGVMKRARAKLLRPAPRLPQVTVSTPTAHRDPLHFTEQKKPLVSIVIPVFNKSDYTYHCLKSVLANSGALPYEVIVVDDCSSDDTAALLKSIAGIVTIRNKKNSGFIHSCNAGAKAARGEFLLMLNNDTDVQPQWLDALVNTFNDLPDAGMVGAKLLFADGTLQEAGGIVWRDGSAWNFGRGDDPNKPEYSYLRAVDYCSGACLLLRRADYKALGQFDTHFAPAYYEDTDLAFKVRAAGKQVYYQPLARVVHFEGISNGTDTSGGTKAYQVANHQKFFERWQSVLKNHRPNAMQPHLEKERRVYKRALVVDARVLMPDNDSGSLRMFNLLKILQAIGYKVTFIPDNMQYHERYTPMLQALGIECWYNPYQQNVTQHLTQFGSLYSLIILSRADIAEKNIDTALRYAPEAQILFDTVDLHFLRERRLAELSGSKMEAEAAELRRLQELSIARKAHQTLVVSPVEVELFKQEAPDVKVALVSNIHAVHGCSTPWVKREHILFIGSFEHPPNVDAMHHFIDDIMPLVQRKRPGIKLLIVGAQVPKALLAKASALIEFAGFVPDITPLFEQVRLSIAPLRYGAGVKGKINSSMAYGVPVIASPIAAEGMGLQHEVDVLIADSPESFATAIVRTYDDEKLWKQLSNGALANLENNFSFAVATKQLRAILK